MHKNRLGKYIVSAILFFGFALALPVEAQQYLGTLAGKVTDASGANVPKAEVSATDVVTHFTTTTVTDEGGNYSIPFLTPDEYSVSITAKGFVLRRGRVLC